MTASRPRDLNSLAKSIVDEATDESKERVERPGKDEKAVQRGKARAESLSPKRRSEIAKKAAEARWGTAGE